MRSTEGPRGVLRRLASDRRGNTAIVFAFALLPIAMAAGGAMDLRRAWSNKSYLQDSADAAVLAAAKGYYSAAGKTRTERLDAARAVADAYMRQAVDRRSGALEAPTWTLSFPEDSGEFIMQASAKSPAAFGGLFGIAALDVDAESVSSAGDRRVEVALVLDSTGSMAGKKLAELKRASTDFVDTLESAAASHPKPDAVKIALVPYNNAVKVGAEYANADWIDKAGASSIHYENLSALTVGKGLPKAERIQGTRKLPTRLELFKALNTNWAGCVESRPMPFDITNDTPDASKPDTLYVPFFAPDEPDRTHTDPHPRRDKQPLQNDYLDDGPLPADASKDWFKRQQNVDKYVAQPFKKGAYGAALGPNKECSVAPVIRLGTGFTSIRTGIKAMKAEGNTNIFIGLHWGWNAVSPTGPFGDGSAYGEKSLDKIIVLMTDGTNVHSSVGNPNNSPYASVGYLIKNRLGITSGSEKKRQDAMDDRLRKLCANVKGTGVIIYAIRVEVDPGASDVMESCATSDEYFHDVQDASELDETFDEIARKILQIRLSR